MVTAHIGIRIREARRQMGLTQAALGERVGASQPVISALERGRYFDQFLVNRACKLLFVGNQEIERRENLGEWLAKLRRETGWNQNQLALESALTVTTISRIENGHNVPTRRTIRLVLRALDREEQWGRAMALREEELDRGEGAC